MEMRSQKPQPSIAGVLYLPVQAHVKHFPSKPLSFSSCRYFRFSVVERKSRNHGRLSRSVAFLASAHGTVCCNERYSEYFMIFLCVQCSVATVNGMQFFCCIFRLLYFSFLHDFFNTFEPSLYPTRR